MFYCLTLILLTVFMYHRLLKFWVVTTKCRAKVWRWGVFESALLFFWVSGFSVKALCELRHRCQNIPSYPERNSEMFLKFQIEYVPNLVLSVGEFFTRNCGAWNLFTAVIKCNSESKVDHIRCSMECWLDSPPLWQVLHICRIILKSINLSK